MPAGRPDRLFHKTSGPFGLEPCGIHPHERDVAHLALGTALRLAVEVDIYAREVLRGDSLRGFEILSQNVFITVGATGCGSCKGSPTR